MYMYENNVKEGGAEKQKKNDEEDKDREEK